MISVCPVCWVSFHVHWLFITSYLYIIYLSFYGQCDKNKPYDLADVGYLVFKWIPNNGHTVGLQVLYTRANQSHSI